MAPRDKSEVVEEMLSKGDTMVCLDSRHPAVQVPDNHKGKEDLRLVLNLNFRRPISTMPEGIEAELLFGGVPFLCWLPYDSLWAVYNPRTGEGYLWPGNTPVRLRDMLADTSGAAEQEADRKSPEPAEEPKPSVRNEDAPAPEAPQKGTAKARPPLRVINGGKKD